MKASRIGAFSYHISFHERALEIIHQGRIPARLVLSHPYPLDQIDRAFAIAAGGGGLKRRWKWNDGHRCDRRNENEIHLA